MMSEIPLVRYGIIKNCFGLGLGSGGVQGTKRRHCHNARTHGTGQPLSLSLSPYLGVTVLLSHVD